jgi:hypothetical protein
VKDGSGVGLYAGGGSEGICSLSGTPIVLDAPPKYGSGKGKANVIAIVYDSLRQSNQQSIENSPRQSWCLRKSALNHLSHSSS